ncbi:MarR family transcriptional regulator [Acidisoma silvae]|uniref:MarR family transcriptional regulator n=1 Tax=Acidisoma silvae TaxID=2802396 RepID=A0A963YW58_9PROT|nr:MarR family transcriptional regulator [Acidisoma silvae]MCB8878256.1 MarR family transcriptional regulator [Acidisoma silvae]
MKKKPDDQQIELTSVLLDRVLDIVRGDDRDLNLRQLAVLLVCYSTSEPQTVRGLAEHLNVVKPAITRALDRLEKAKLVRRKYDPADKRSIHVAVTRAGERYGEMFLGGSLQQRASVDG